MRTIIYASSVIFFVILASILLNRNTGFSSVRSIRAKANMYKKSFNTNRKRYR